MHSGPYSDENQAFYLALFLLQDLGLLLTFENHKKWVNMMAI